MNKWFFVALILIQPLQTFAFEDCVITTSEKVSEIKVEDDSILNARPLVTIENKKNIIFINPLSVGETKIYITRDNNQKATLEVKITETETIISQEDDFEIISLDMPPEVLEIDLPPIKTKETEEKNG